MDANAISPVTLPVPLRVCPSSSVNVLLRPATFSVVPLLKYMLLEFAIVDTPESVSVPAVIVVSPEYVCALPLIVSPPAPV